MSQQVRVRLAPSPTGSDVHIGNVRTALFNYLLAKKLGGTFILRMEDSDQARSKSEYADNIVNTLKWLGLNPDEGYGTNNQPFGPYKQMEKLERYKQVAEQLISEGKAYRCYCSKDEIEEQRKSLLEKDPKAQFKYPGTCRDRKDYPEGKDFVIRFRAPTDGNIVLNDIVFGNITTPNKENQDFVIMRSNGVPLYNFGCVVDDIDHKITHVIRGRDHLVNYTPQALLYEALNHPIPVMAHLPMMLGKDGTKLSKRHGSVSISEFRKAGYSPNAILNYLAKFGWGYKDQEIFTLEELVDKFDLSGCKRADGKFDPTKFEMINFEHLKDERLTPSETYVDHLTSFISAPKEDVHAVIHAVRDKAKTFKEAAEKVKFFFEDNIQIDAELSKKHLQENNKQILNELKSVLNSIENWSETNIKETIQNWLKVKNLSMKDVGQPIRIAITGGTISPELFKTIHILGKNKTSKRLSLQ